jgi:hypothetical protein
MSGRDSQSKTYNNEILRQFNVNRVLFDSGRSPFLRQPTIDPPKVVDFINELDDVSVNLSRYHKVDVKKFVNEFVPRIARPGDVIILDGSYRHMRNGRLIFSLGLTEIRIARSLNGQIPTPKEAPLFSNNNLFGRYNSDIDVIELMSNIQDYVLNSRRR